MLLGAEKLFSLLLLDLFRRGFLKCFLFILQTPPNVEKRTCNSTDRIRQGPVEQGTGPLRQSHLLWDYRNESTLLAL